MGNYEEAKKVCTMTERSARMQKLRVPNGSCCLYFVINPGSRILTAVRDLMCSVSGKICRFSLE
jgi:hypothetical protein